MTYSLFGLALVRTSELKALRSAAAQAVKQTPPSEETASPPAGPPVGAAGTPPPFVRELIRFADGLHDLKGASAPNEPPDPVLRWAQEAIAALLGACDVARVHEAGGFNPHRHQAVGRRIATDPALPHQIAETVRPGYAWNGALLRPQQVIVYAPAEPSSSQPRATPTHPKDDVS
jgi:GrpE